MGVIARQSIKTLVVEVIGIVIGFFSMLFIYPLEDSLFGFMQFLFSFGIFLVPIMSLGLPSFVIKFNPFYQNVEGAKNSFLTILVLLSFFLFFLFIGLALVFKTPIYSFLSNLNFDVALIRQNANYLLIIGFLQIQIALFTSYLSNFGKIALPTLIFQTGYKLFLPLAVLAYVYNYYDFKYAPLYLIGFLALVLVILIIYSHREKLFFFTKKILIPPAKKIKEMLSFLSFSSLTSISNLLAFRIDMIMIASLLSLQANGIYAKILIIASIIDLPTKILSRTASPEISRAWEILDMNRIQSIYKKSSLNLFLLGSFLFILLWFILGDLISISSNPASFENGQLIFLFLGIGKLIDLIASVNKSIIGYSPSYKINFLLIAFLGIVNVVLNYFLIGRFEVVGAAISTGISLLLYNVIKLCYILYKYKMHPFTKELLVIIMVGVFTFITMSFIPFFSNSFLNLFLKSFLILLLFGIPILILKPSLELVESYQKIVQRLKR